MRMWEVQDLVQLERRQVGGNSGVGVTTEPGPKKEDKPQTTPPASSTTPYSSPDPKKEDTPQVGIGSPPASSTTPLLTAEPLKPKSNNGPTAAAATMGVLFGIALIIIALLLFRERRRKKRENEHLTVPLSDSGVTYLSPQGPEKNELAALQNALREANNRADTLQGALLAAKGKFIPRNPRDDKQIGMEFEQITQEIKDYTGNFFKSSRSPGSASPKLVRSQVSPQLAETIAHILPDWELILSNEGTKGKAILVRAAVWSVLQKAWEEGEIFGKLGYEQMTVYMALLENGNEMADVQFWRRATFAMLVNSPTFNTMRNQAVENITTQIDQLLNPLASSPPSHERYQFLLGTVQKVQNLALELSQQVADYRVQVSNFTLDTGSLDCPASPAYFEARTMDDVMQAYQTAIGPDGVSKNALEGKPIRGVVSPAVVKWGDHRGENWESVTVVAKAKVLV